MTKIVKITSHSVMAQEKNDVIASEINHENDTYSMLKLKILSAIKFVLSKKKHADIESIYDQLMKTNSSNQLMNSYQDSDYNLAYSSTDSWKPPI